MNKINNILEAIENDVEKFDELKLVFIKSFNKLIQDEEELGNELCYLKDYGSDNSILMRSLKIIFDNEDFIKKFSLYEKYDFILNFNKTLKKISKNEEYKNVHLSDFINKNKNKETIWSFNKYDDDADFNETFKSYFNLINNNIDMLKTNDIENKYKINFFDINNSYKQNFLFKKDIYYKASLLGNLFMSLNDFNNNIVDFILNHEICEEKIFLKNARGYLILYLLFMFNQFKDDDVKNTCNKNLNSVLNFYKSKILNNNYYKEINEEYKIDSKILYNIICNIYSTANEDYDYSLRKRFIKINEETVISLLDITQGFFCLNDIKNNFQINNYKIDSLIFSESNMLNILLKPLKYKKVFENFVFKIGENDNLYFLNMFLNANFNEHKDIFYKHKDFILDKFLNNKDSEKFGLFIRKTLLSDEYYMFLLENGILNDEKQINFIKDKSMKGVFSLKNNLMPDILSDKMILMYENDDNNRLFGKSDLNNYASKIKELISIDEIEKIIELIKKEDEINIKTIKNITDNSNGLKKVSRKHSHLLKTSKIINKSQLINSFIVIAMKQYTINDYDESNRDKLQKMINNNKIFILENYILLTECISEQLLNNNNLYRNHLYMINCEDVSNRIDEIQKMIKFDINLTPSKKRIKNI